METIDKELTLIESILGVGHEKCDTAQAIEGMPTPVEVAEELKFTTTCDDQAYAIVTEIYQPLIGLITMLKSDIDKLTDKINKGE